MPRWGFHYGGWWALGWSVYRPLTLGAHLELRRQRTNEGVAFGPYLDVHLPFLDVSIGVRPAHAGDVDKVASYARQAI